MGPSVAILVIPTTRPNWPGGGASLWLWGDNNSLWPSKLTNAHIGSSYCVSPDADTLGLEGLSTQDCIWSGFSPLLEFFKQAHLDLPTFFNYHDGIVSHNLVISPKEPPSQTFVYTIHLATGVILSNAAQLWYKAMTAIPNGAVITHWHIGIETQQLDMLRNGFLWFERLATSSSHVYTINLTTQACKRYAPLTLLVVFPSD